MRKVFPSSTFSQADTVRIKPDKPEPQTGWPTVILELDYISARTPDYDAGLITWALSDLAVRRSSNHVQCELHVVASRLLRTVWA